MRFLVADDDAVHRTMLRRMIESLGHSADVAQDGAEAVASTRLKQYDIVLLDIHMPAMNGFEAARTIARSTNPPFVAMLTADTGSESRSAGLLSGAGSVLTKPVRLDTLRDLAASREDRGDASSVDHLAAPGQNGSTDVYAADPILDQDILQAFRETMGSDDPEFSRELEMDFIRDAFHLADSIERTAERNDLAPMARAAHTLKSNARMFGAMRLSSRARSLERLADAGLPYPWQPQLRSVRADIETVARLLQVDSTV